MDERAKALAALAAERWRVALLLTGAMMLIYFGFILLIAFNKPLMGTLVIPGLIPIGNESEHKTRFQNVACNSASRMK
jgi:uncharacterized membrane protein (DUF485 family)